MRLARTLGCLIVLACLALPGVANPMAELEPIALETVAARLQVPLEDLTVLASATGVYPFTGAVVYEYKLWSSTLAEVAGVALDHTGGEIDLAMLELAERDAFQQTYGRLDPELADLVMQLAPEETVPVVVWLYEPESTAPQRPDRESELTAEELNDVLARVAEQRELFISELVAPIAERAGVSGMNVTVDRYAPILSGDLTSGQLMEINTWPEVERIYLQHHPELLLDTAREAVNAGLVNSCGITGYYPSSYRPVEVAIVEGQGELVATNNPYLPGVIQDPNTGCTGGASEHATRVAGTLASTSPTYGGIANDVSLFATTSCPSFDGDLQNAFNRAVSWGAKIVNLSFGKDEKAGTDGVDRWYDSKVQSLWRTVTAGAGNYADLGRHVASPAKGYNVIAVGAIYDNNTGFPWSDDTMWQYSNHLNPTSWHNDREKPEVVAPGAMVISTIERAPWVETTWIPGTSFSSPIVAGAAALLLGAKTTLGAWPEGVKAILMATAVHNVEGDARLSGKDGAGMIDAYEAFVVADGRDPFSVGKGRGNWGNTDHRCGSSPTTRDLATIQLEAGKVTRVAMVWSQNTRYYWYGDQPSADLDLSILAPSGGKVAHSISWDSNFEIVRFTPATTGAYTLRMTTFRCDEDPPYLAWAWWQYRR